MTLVRAWRLVLDTRPDAQLTLAGTGVPSDPTQDRIRALLAADLRLSNAVKLPGWVADVRELLASHDVFVLLSDAEGMSNALLEAAAYGRVCVVSDIPANRAVLGQDHTLFAPTDDELQISGVILKAFDSRADRELCRAQSFAAAKRSDLRNVSERFAELLGTR